jgi:phage-related protein
MAVTESLLYDIKVDTKNASGNVDGLNQTLASLNKTLAVLGVSISYMQQEMLNLAVTFSKLNANAPTLANVPKSLDKTTKSVETVAKQTEAYTEVLVENNSAVQNTIDAQTRTSQAFQIAGQLIAGTGITIATVAYKMGMFDKAIQTTSKTMAAFAGYTGKTAEVLGKGLHLSLFSAIEAINLASPALVLFGSLLKQSDSQTLRFIGTLTQWAGIIMGGVAGAIGYLTYLLGGFIETIGTRMISSMDAAEQKFAKFQAVMSQFTFTIQGFGKVFGTETVGSVDKWNRSMEEVYNTTTFTREEIAKSIKLLVADGRVLGLTAEQNTKLLKRTADIAAANGRDLAEVTQMIVSALTNNSSAVLSLGIDLRDTALEHGKYAEATGLSLEQMNSQEIAMVRLNALYDKTIPIMGAAKNAIETITGSNAVYEKTMDNITIKLGEVGVFTRMYMTFVNKLAASFAYIIEPFLSFIGTMQDFLGVLLIVIGKTIKYIAIIVSLITIFKLLSVAATTFLGISFSLGAAISLLATRILPWIGLLIVLRNSYEDLMYKSEGFRTTVESMAMSLDIFGSDTAQAKEDVSVLTKTFVSFSALVKMALNGMVQTINLVAKSIVWLKSQFETNEETLQIYEMQIQEIDSRLANLNKTNDESIKQFGLWGNSVAMASEQVAKAGQTTEEQENLFVKFKERVVKAAKEINSSYDPVIEKQKYLGDEFQKAIATAIQAKSEMDRVFKTKTTEKESAQKYADAERASIQATLEIEKLRLDTIKKIVEQRKQLEAEVLKSQGRNIEAIKLETKESLAAIDKQIEGLKLLGGLRQEDIDELNRTKKIIEQLGGKKIAEEQEKHLDKVLGLQKLVADIKSETSFIEKNEVETLKEKIAARTIELSKMEAQLKASNDLSNRAKQTVNEGKAALKAAEANGIAALQKKNLDDLIKGNDELRKSNAEGNMTAYQQAQLNYEIQKKANDAKFIELGMQGLLTEEMIKQFDEREKLLKLEKNQKGSPSTKIFQSMELGSQKAAGAITGVFTKGTMGMVSGAASVVGMVVQAIGGLADMITGFFDTVASGFNKILDLPKVLPGLIMKAGESVVNFTADFLPQFIEKLPDMIMKAVDMFVSQVGEANGKMFEMLLPALEGFFNKLPEIVQKLITQSLRAIGTTIAPVIKFVFQFIFREIPVLIKMIIKDLIPGIINGIADGIKEAAKEFSRLTSKGLFSGKMPKIKVDAKQASASLTKSVKKGMATLTGESSKIFNVSDLTGTEKAMDKAKETANAVKEAMKKGTDYLKMWWNKLLKALKDIWMYIYDKILSPIMKVFSKLWDNISIGLTALWNGLKAIWDGVITALSSIWEFVKTLWDTVISALQGIWDSLKQVWNTIISKLGELWAGLKSIWNTVWEKLQSFWDSLASIWSGVWEKLQGVWDGLKTAVSDAVNTLTDGIKNLPETLKNAVSGLVDAFKNLGGNIAEGLQNALSTVWEGFKGLGGKIIDGLKDAFGNIGDTFSGWGGKIWDGLKAGLNGLGSFFTDMFDKLNPGNLFSKIFKVDMGGTGTVEKTIGIDVPFMSFASGGMVPGQSVVNGDSLLNDRILALLSPGEAIIPRSKMQDPKVAAIVKQILDGSMKVPQFALGGTLGSMVSQVSDAIKEVAAEVDPIKQMWEQVKSMSMDMIMEMFRKNKFHSGGPVSFAGGGEVPSMLQSGEYVLNRNAVSSIGTGMLNRINGGAKPETPSNPTFNISIDIKTTEAIDEAFFRQKVLPKVKEELKRSSLNGDFIISAKGVR